MKLAALARQLAAREIPAGGVVLKQSPVRSVVQVGDLVVKVFHKRARKVRREARTLHLAHARGISVPELIDHGDDWIATRLVEARPATREDLQLLLPAIANLHARGMLHRDLHLGNVLMRGSEPVFLDTQKAYFLPRLPAIARAWELGYFAFSLGEPLPESLEHVRWWRDRRAQTHWRSRTARCTVESSGFSRLRIELPGVGPLEGYRRREVSVASIETALTSTAQAEKLKETERSGLLRWQGWILKRHRSANAARASWRGGFGLEVRGIRAARVLAWLGPWVIMQDTGPTLTDWVEQHSGTPGETELELLSRQLAQLLARLHETRVYHPDLKANNVCWHPGSEPSLIDFGDVRFGRRVSSRRRVKNLAQLNAALPDQVPNAIRARTLARYLRASGSAENESELQRRVIELSLKRDHRWSGC